MQVLRKFLWGLPRLVEKLFLESGKKKNFSRMRKHICVSDVVQADGVRGEVVF
jgi:hypothetical protein